MWLFLVFVSVPIVEIALFVQVGGAIGLWPTLAIVILTASIGTSLMRAQGLSTLNRLQTSLGNGSNPADPIAQGAMILVAGVLLLTPGFFTDALGFALLVPPLRRWIIRWVMSRMAIRHETFSPKSSRTHDDSKTINGEFSVVDEASNTINENPSGWTKH